MASAHPAPCWMICFKTTAVCTEDEDYGDVEKIRHSHLLHIGCCGWDDNHDDAFTGANMAWHSNEAFRAFRGQGVSLLIVMLYIMKFCIIYRDFRSDHFESSAVHNSR